MALGETRQSIRDVMALDAPLKVSDAEAYKHLPRKAMARHNNIQLSLMGVHILDACLVLHFWNHLMRQLMPDATVYDAVPHNSMTDSLLRNFLE